MMTHCKSCSPHCDFCIHAEYYLSLNGGHVKWAIKGCKLHSDDHHKWLARNLEYCQDFYCYKVDIKEE